MPDLPLGAAMAFDFKAWDVRAEIALVQHAGIRRVQIYRNYTQNISADHIRETVLGAGLVIDSLHGYFQLEEDLRPRFDISSGDEEVRRAGIEIMRGEAAFAQALGCRDIIVHPVAPGDTQHDPFRRAALEASARDLAAIGRETGVRFLIENMPPPMFGRDAAMVHAIIEEIGSPQLGQCYDAGHAMLAGDPLGTIRAMGSRLWAVHLHDNHGADDDHMIPGMGTVPFEDVARTLAEVGFAATFMLEIYRDTTEVRRDMTPERLAFIERLRQIASGP
jgi:sugar phosphate isomerase/epimerase